MHILIVLCFIIWVGWHGCTNQDAMSSNAMRWELEQCENKKQDYWRRDGEGGAQPQKEGREEQKER